MPGSPDRTPTTYAELCPLSRPFSPTTSDGSLFHSRPVRQESKRVNPAEVYDLDCLCGSDRSLQTRTAAGPIGPDRESDPYRDVLHGRDARR